MFNSNQEITIALEGKQCRVRWPSEQEWLTWAEGEKYKANFAHSRQRGARLFRAIRTDTGAPFSSWGAARVVECLADWRMVSFEREGEECRIEIEGLDTRTKHVLRMPSVQELIAHREGFIRKRFGHRTTVSVRPTAELYDKLHISHSGYVGEVPLVHKLAAIAGVIERISSDEQTLWVHLVKSI